MSRYVLLRHTDGTYLSSQPGGVTTRPHADDSSLWIERPSTDAGPSFASATDGYVLATDNPDWSLADLAVDAGPVRRPSEHLAELHANGWTVIENVLSSEAIARVKVRVAEHRAAEHADEPATDGHFWIRSSLAWCLDVARAACHPVALWLLEQYLATSDVHFCHQPVITTLKPADELAGTHPPGGWHSDYPYHPGVFPKDDWPEAPALGAQYNVCIDAFEPHTGATQFLPGSHTLGRGPHPSFNESGTCVGEGEHVDVAQMLAPAGAALIYDARIWHRTCHELNLNGADRMAILHAAAPAWVRPMMDKTWLTDRYRASPVPASLTNRERADIERLCHVPTLATPKGMPRIRAKRRL